MAAILPPAIITKLRRICAKLPEVYEEAAWVGVRWMIRKRTFAHVVMIDHGSPPAYAKAANEEGPLVVLTVRIDVSGAFDDPRFFEAVWGTNWGTKVLGVKLRPPVDWKETGALVGESYRLLAPKKLVATIARRERGTTEACIIHASSKPLVRRGA